MFTGDNRGFFYCHLMSPNVTQSVSVSAMLRYGKKTDQDVFEPTMWEKEARHIWWSGKEFRHLIQCINMHFGPYIYSVSQ